MSSKVEPIEAAATRATLEVTCFSALLASELSQSEQGNEAWSGCCAWSSAARAPTPPLGYLSPTKCEAQELVT
jgi:hypothetical protein